ncbi:unnamed protein product [Brassica rapa]|uniref:Uncharacterized protein n=2 Tax=Brassica TaxID=3705 RepID=A0A8D9HGW4_BRACM|nr:unnamed protein product [Brassica napus]CAG7899278.1 unnamed protein product [Brassica rapa]
MLSLRATCLTGGNPSVSLVDLLLSLFSSLETGGVRFEGLWRCRQWGHGLTVDTEAFERAVVEICSVTHWLACLRFLSPHLLVFLSISCSTQDKLLHILALLKLEVVQKKVLIFINTIDMGFNGH